MDKADSAVVAAGATGNGAPASAPLSENPRRFSLAERIQISAASWIGYFATWLIGRSLRWEVHGWENWQAAQRAGKGLVYTFWHREICAATWFWRKRGIVVMTSRNFDGEYIARIIRRHGYGAARGSSSRGAGRALVEMIQSLKRGHDGAFTIDGPRGPRFVAKQGSVIVAKASGAAIVCFHIAPKLAYVFRRSWDKLQLPCPFTKAAVFIAPPIAVAAGANADEQARKLREVQAALEGLQRQGEAWLAKEKRRGSAGG
jgi:lysophospholipid acyltransferase (LPLAT)-like uncharacterized protein